MSQKTERTNAQHILITGVAGFIGSHLAERFLSKGARVTGIDNFDNFYSRHLKELNLKEISKDADFSFVEADIRKSPDLERLNNNSFDLVIHLAAKAGVLPSIKEPGEYIKTNITGTFNLLEWMKINRIKKLIFASSSSIYGNSPIRPFSENLNTDNPISPYAFTKKACELMNYTYHQLNKFDVLNLRLFTVYGERQRPDLAIFKFVKKILEDEEIVIYGDGETSRDYTYIRDIVKGFEHATNFILEKKNIYEVINLGNNSPVSLNELVNKLSFFLNKPVKMKYISMQPGDVNHTFADISKAKMLFGYQPDTPIEEGLKNFINWYLKNKKL